jgi:hypothetical protein
MTISSNFIQFCNFALSLLHCSKLLETFWTLLNYRNFGLPMRKCLRKTKSQYCSYLMGPNGFQIRINQLPVPATRWQPGACIIKHITAVIYGFSNKLEHLPLNTTLGWKGLPETNTLAYYGNCKLRL